MNPQYELYPYILYGVSIILPPLIAIIAKLMGKSWKKGLIIGLVFAGIYNLIDFQFLTVHVDWHGMTNLIGAGFALASLIITSIMGAIGSRIMKN